MKFIAYYRVSTSKQEQSGLGLESQRSHVEAFARRLEGEIIGDYTDIESGKSNKRQELAKAMQQAKATGATLLIAKLDRLSRDVNFISGLMKEDVAFLACDNPTANKLTVHLFAAIAEHEREMISDRTRKALQALKARGVELGTPGNFSDEGRAKGRATRMQQARENEHNRRATAFAQELHNSNHSLTEIASKLTAMGFTTATGKPFAQPVQVKRLLERAKATQL
jgi:DNA invertase Pin-like site-specific DNA recombinase